MPAENFGKLIIDVFYKLRANFNQISLPFFIKKRKLIMVIYLYILFSFMFCSYINLNAKSSSKYRSYLQKVVKWNLLDKPKKYVKHCLERINKVEQIDSNDIQVIERNRLFKVKSSAKEIFHQLDLGDKYSFPTCNCHDWKKHLMPCKHFLALFDDKTGICWNSLADIYFNIDYEVFQHPTIRKTSLITI